MSEIYYFEVEHTKFYKYNVGDIWLVNFPIGYQLENDQLS